MMKNSEYLSKLYRPPLEEKKSVDYICLDKNEPPFSAFNSVSGLFEDEDIFNLREYPNLYDLYEKLATFAKVPIDSLLLTQGSEQAIKSVFEVFVDEDDEVIHFTPSFAMYDVFTYQKRAKHIHLNFNDDGSMSVENILKSISKRTRLFSLINPHNFTGSSLTMNELERIAKHTFKTNTIFLLDEAYFHYLSLNSISLIDRYPNVIITRTFSKALGIAGARVGYAISSPENITLLRKVKPIDEIDYLAGVLAKKVLENADIILDKNVSQVQKWQKIFSESSIENMEYIDTKANFILLKSFKYIQHRDILLNNYIIPKYEFQDNCLKNCIRFSVTNDEIMQKILNLLRGEIL